MQLEYRLTEEDYIRFNEYHFKHSPTMRRNAFGFYLSGPIGMVIVFCTENVSVWLRLIVCVPILVLWLCLAPYLYKRLIRGRLKKMLGEGDNTILFGQYIVKIGPEGFTGTTAAAKNEMKWKGISKVAAGEHGVYLYNSGASAYLVPNTAFDAVNTRERFLEEVLRYREMAAGLIETA